MSDLLQKLHELFRARRYGLIRYLVQEIRIADLLAPLLQLIAKVFF